MNFVSLHKFTQTMAVALFPGSFDPFTRGHAALVEQALRLFDRVVIGIGDNIAKHSLLSIEARRRLIEDFYAAEERVEVVVYRGFTGDCALECGADAIVRGVRNSIDFEYEKTMQAANRRLFPELVTVLLMTPSEVSDIASSTVREVLAFGRDVADLMPEGVDLKRYIAEDKN